MVLAVLSLTSHNLFPHSHSPVSGSVVDHHHHGDSPDHHHDHEEQEKSREADPGHSFEIGKVISKPPDFTDHIFVKITTSYHDSYSPEALPEIYSERIAHPPVWDQNTFKSLIHTSSGMRGPPVSV
jgi:hypothetical protein